MFLPTTKREVKQLGWDDIVYYGLICPIHIILLNLAQVIAENKSKNKGKIGLLCIVEVSHEKCFF